MLSELQRLEEAVLPRASLVRPRTRIVAGAVVLVVLLTAIVVVRHAGQWLVDEDQLQHAKAVVVLGGHLPLRAIEAAAIYRDGWVDEAWLTPGAPSAEERAMAKRGIDYPSESDYSRKVLEADGVPAGVIRELPGPTDNTDSEIRSIAEALGKSERVVIVTSKYHTRRVRALWSRQAADRLPAIVRYTRDDPFDAAHWWRTTDDSMAVAREWFGLLNAWLGFPVRSAR